MNAIKKLLKLSARSRLAVACLLFFALLSPSALAKKCTIIYALEGIPYQSFSSQLDALHWHLKQLDITLIDLNHWHSAPLHEPLSGRERALLRDRFVLNAPHTGAVLLNRHGTILQRYEHMVDLVDLLMTCQSPQRSQPRHRQMASQQ